MSPVETMVIMVGYANIGTLEARRIVIVSFMIRGLIMKNKKFQCRYCIGAQQKEDGAIYGDVFMTNSKSEFLIHIRTCKHKGVKLVE